MTRFIATLICAAFTAAPAAEKIPHVVFIIGEREYKTKETLPAFAKAELEPRKVKCTFVFASSDKDKNKKHDFPGFEAVAGADLVLISVRRRALKPEQMKMLKAHLDAGKPLIGIRTASHAFDTRGKHPKGLAEWKKFDPEVLGGNYTNHHGRGITAKIAIVEKTKDHPILKGMEAFSSNGSLYKVSPLTKTAVPLLTGTIPNADPEPVAWTFKYKKARIFYTSLGYVDDFKDENFKRLFTNAFFWAMDKPVPAK